MKDISLLIAQPDELPTMLPHSLTTRIAVTGVGPTSAREFMSRLLVQGAPEQIIVLGYCGCVCDDVSIGTVMIAESCSHAGKTIRLKPPEKLLRKFKAVKYEFAAYESFAHVVTSRRDVAKGTEAVDMESFFLAEAAIKYHVPILIAKTVSDIVPESQAMRILGRLFGQPQFDRTNLITANFQSSVFVQNYVKALSA